MIGVIIHETVGTEEDLPELLLHIAAQVADGMTSGYHPGWEITWDTEQRRQP